MAADYHKYTLIQAVYDVHATIVRKIIIIGRKDVPSAGAVNVTEIIPEDIIL